MPKNKRKQRNFGGIPGFGDDGVNPNDMWNVFETGTILLESDEGKKTTVRVENFTGKPIKTGKTRYRINELSVNRRI